MPVYKYEIEVGRKLTDAEKQELHDVVARAWAGMQRISERNAALAKTMHARHLERVEVWATDKAGKHIYDADTRRAHLECSDCTRELVGHGTGGGLACPEVARHPAAAATACHSRCVVECGEGARETVR